MLNLYQMEYKVAEKFDRETETDYLSKVGSWLNDHYERLWNKYLWKEICVIDRIVNTVSGTAIVTLPSDVGEILYLTERQNNVLLTGMDARIFQQRYLAEITSQSNPVSYMRVADAGVETQLSANGAVEIVSDDNSDTTQTVRVWGKDANEHEIQEQITLNGTTAAVGTKTFSEILTVSKSDVTAGNISIRTSGGATTLAVIPPREYGVRYKRIQLHYVPNAIYPLYLGYKKPFRRLQFAEDIPQFECGRLIIKGAYAEALKKERQFAKSRMERQELEGEISEFLMLKTQQADGPPIFMPHVETSDIDKYGYGNI